MSRQLRRGSNCSAVHDASDERSPTPSAWPTMLPKLRRFVPSMPAHQRGLVARSSRLASVGRGGVDSPFLMSLWRWPRICRSSVTCSAETPAALARSIRRSTKSRSRITYTWNQKPGPACCATSSMEQMLMVESVNGTPKARAARAPRDLAVGVLHAGEARRRYRHRHGHVLPHHPRARGAVFHVHRHALAQLDLLEILGVGAIGALRVGTGIGIVVEHARNAPAGDGAQVFDAGDAGQWTHDGRSWLLFCHAAGSCLGSVRGQGHRSGGDCRKG